MAAIDWGSAVSGLWTTAANWSPETVPGSGDAVTIGVAGTYTVTLTTAVTVDSLAVSDVDATLSIAASGGTETVTATLNNSGTIDVAATALKIGGATANSGSLSLTGATALTAAAVANKGVFDLDADLGDSGGGSASLNGLTNSGQIDIGNSSLAGTVTMTVKGLSNAVSGAINLVGGSGKAVLDDVYAAPTTLSGLVSLDGAALLEYGSGGITTIAADAQLSLDGTGARVTSGSATGSNSALTGLATNDGEFDLAEGAAVATTVAYVNNYYTYVDSEYSNGDLAGGSTLTIGGTLTNNDYMDIGNYDARSATTVTATGLFNNDEIDITGEASRATLNILGAAPTTVIGSYYLDGNALLEFASGSFTTIGGDGELWLDGPAVHVALSSDTSANGALSRLSKNAGQFYVLQGVAITTTVGFVNDAETHIDDEYSGGSSFSIGGTLTNNDYMVIGNEDILAATTVSAKALVNHDEIDLSGSDTVQATLKIAAAAPGTLSGDYYLAGDALLSYGSGAITAIATGLLSLNGANARVSSGTTTASNSALTTLATIAADGGLEMAGGTVVSTTKGLDVAGSLSVDNSGAGASKLTIGGTLTIALDRTIYIGNTGITAATTVTAAALVNRGGIAISGNSAVQASLGITAAAPATLTGDFYLDGDAALFYGSGSITAIGSDAVLELSGARATVSSGTSETANSALTKLATIASGGELVLADGATLTTTTGLNNAGTLEVDSAEGDGGSKLTIGGTLTDTVNRVDIGNIDLAKAVTVTVGNLSGVGVYLTGGPSVLARLNIGAAAPAVESSSLYLTGDALVAYASGAITTISGGVTLDGRLSRIASGTATSTNSALTKLATITGSGALTLEDGAVVTTTTALNDGGSLEVDDDGPGGSKLTVGGTLTYSAGYELDIGNESITAATTVSAKGLADTGSNYIDITGGATAQAELDIAAAAPATLDGSFILTGDALLLYKSGAIATIENTVELDGAAARIASGTTTTGNSALTTLTDIAGYFEISNGVSITTSTALTVSGELDVDSTYGSGGSKLAIGGTLTNNSYDVEIGNDDLSAATTVTAAALSNSETIDIAGSATVQATLKIAAAVTATLSGNYFLDGDALLSYGSGGVTTISGDVDLDGAKARISTGAATGSNSALTDLASVGSGAYFILINGATVSTTVALTNSGQLEVDEGAGGGSKLTIGGTLTNDAQLNIGNDDLTANTTVTTAGFDNTWYTSLEGGNFYIAKLVVNGNVVNTGYEFYIGAQGELDVTGANSFTQSSSETLVYGTLLAPTINVNGGTLDFYAALASGTGTINIGAGTVAFGTSAAVAASHTVDFVTLNGTLGLSAPSTFLGTIGGFSGNDVIDLEDIAATGLSYSGSTSSGTLTVTGASGTIATLAFGGDYTTASFSLQSDGSGGTEILDPPSSTLNLAGASSQNVAFAAGKLTSLTLADAPDYKGKISGFAAGDTIDLADIAFSAHTTLGYRETKTGGVLTVSDGSEKARLALLGQYMASSFALSSDGHGGTLVSEPATAVQNHLAAGAVA